jgi:uncharacterized protein (TIGR03066 family)
MKAKLVFAVVAGVALFISGCGSSTQDMIVGKWEAGETGFKLTVEFAKGGTAKITMLGQTLRGTYKLNGDELEWTMGGKSTKSKAKVTETEMELTSEGKTIKYKRA